MQQTPVHEVSNPDLLQVMPVDSLRVVEVGCSSGALARDYKLRNTGCWYLGCDIDASYVDLARRYCDDVMVLDIDNAKADFYQAQAQADLWVFGDTLEHMKDPWQVLRNVRAMMRQGGVVVACIPNAQHWSVQVRLNVGEFRYEDSGLLDRTHLRWFTRKTMVEMFEQAGFQVELLVPRIFDDPNYNIVAPVIEELAEVCGADPKEALADARPLQYVLKAVAF